MAAIIVGRSKVGGSDHVGGASLTLVIADAAHGHTVETSTPFYSSPVTVTRAQGNTTFMVPSGVTSITYTLRTPAGSAALNPGGVGVIHTGTINLTSAGVDPGELLHLIFENGASGGAQGAGLGPGGAGGPSASIRTSAAKADTLAMAGSGGGGSGGVGGTGTTLDTQAQTPSNATAGSSGGALQYGGGGGGAGWRGGTGGASNNGGQPGTSMYHSTHVTSPNVVSNPSGFDDIQIAWSPSDPTLVPADTAHGHTVEAVSVTQVHVIAVADTLHAHTVETVALTQVHALTVADAFHEHAVESVTLTQVHTLAGVADTAHGHTADNVTVAQAHTIVVADALHAHTAENATLTQTHNLVVADVAHDHAVENVTLTQGHVITVADAFHGHSVEPVVLTQVHTLTVADAVHAHIVEAGAVFVVTLATLYADGHITGTISDPANVLGEPDGLWSTDSTASWHSRFSMENIPIGATLNGRQIVSIVARRTAGEGLPVVAVELWENGEFIGNLVEDAPV